MKRTAAGRAEPRLSFFGFTLRRLRDIIQALQLEQRRVR